MRKNKIIQYTAFALLLIIAGCSSNTPKSVAERFFKAMGKNDFDAAKKHGTENTGKILEMLKGFQNMFTPNAKREHKYEIIFEKIESDSTAIITYKIDGNEKDQILNMVKEVGTWKVAMNIENMDDGAEDPMDAGATTTDEDSTETK